MKFLRRSENRKKIATTSKALAKKAGKAAQEVVEIFANESQLSSSSKSIPTLKNEDIGFGKILGQGGFNVVLEVTLSGRRKKTYRYAMKQLKPDIMSKPEDFVRAAADLVSEACILSSLHHPNIIKLHAVSNKPISDAFRDLESNNHYFLILDHLECTVLDKLNEWRRKRSCSQEENIDIRSNEYQMQIEQRIQSIGLPVARALKYLHSKEVVYRDLKPSNVGFDHNGTIKLFDFGIARELPGGSQMKGASGSRRYMAPEVILSQFFGIEADVFSFGVFLWEIASLQVPFENLVATRSEYINEVALNDYRPELGPQCGSAHIQELIQRCWSARAGSRPNMSEVVAKLSEKQMPQDEGSTFGAHERHAKSEVLTPLSELKESSPVAMKESCSPSNYSPTKTSDNYERFWNKMKLNPLLRDPYARTA